MSQWLKVIEDLSYGVQDFEKNFPLEEFAAGNYKQYPKVTLLTCADSRMPVSMLGPIFNNIFSIENIGNQFKNGAGSVLYGLLHLHTPLFIVAGHTDCGAVIAAGSDFSSEPMEIQNELTTLKSTLSDIQQANYEFSSEPSLKINQLAELNVDKQIDYALGIEEVRKLVDSKELLILGIMVDLHNNYGGGYGKIYTTNCNGITDINAIKEILPDGFFKERVKRLVTA
ncbi:MAG: carbonic anhydrase [Syntrophomonadaceae bacterium]|nr:carbonic anhydrase [Syntrophomonadaceae bacterium]